jgi:DNA-binding MarR family transcriptional regulator
MAHTTQDSDNPEPLTLGVGFLLWQAANSWQRAQRAALAPFDLTPVQLLLLAGLDELTGRSDRPVKQAALARYCRCDVMMTSQVVRGLERRSLMERAVHTDDARAHAVVLTGKGGHLVAEAVPVLTAVDEGYFRVMGGDRAALAGALAALSGTRQRVRIKAISR